MHRVPFVLACLAYTGQGSGVEASIEEIRSSSDTEDQKSLTTRYTASSWQSLAQIEQVGDEVHNNDSPNPQAVLAALIMSSSPASASFNPTMRVGHSSLSRPILDATQNPASLHRLSRLDDHLINMNELASDSNDDEAEEAKLIKKKGSYVPYKPKDNRDLLLYDVVDITPPPKKLGMFRLDPKASTGDLISAPVRVEGTEEKIDQFFVIKKVEYKYKYLSGKYRMVAKGAHVKAARRELTESFLKQLLPELRDSSLDPDEGDAAEA